MTQSPYPNIGALNHDYKKYTKPKNVPTITFGRARVTAPVKYTFDNSQSRYTARGEGIHFPLYNLAVHGLLTSKPNICYRAETYTRLAPAVPYLVGIELEIEQPGYSNDDLKDLAIVLQRYLPKAHYCCHDGSVPNGLEIVTAPRSPQEIKNNFYNYFQALKEITSLGWRSHDSGRCGLHMHITRSTLTNTQWRSMQRMINRYAPFFKALSRREKRQNTDRDTFYYCEFRENNNQNPRYTAVNFENSNTIEFRFFRGTLNTSSFLGSLDTILSLVNYYRSVKVGTIKGFLKHTARNHKYAQKMFEPHLHLLPTPETRRRLTDAERAAKKARILERREREEQNLTYEINSLVANAAYDYNTYLGHQTYSLQPGDEMVSLYVPVKFTGRFRNALLERADTIPYSVAITIPKRLRQEYIIDGRFLYIRSIRGYGRSRIVHRLGIHYTPSPNSTYAHTYNNFTQQG